MHAQLQVTHMMSSDADGGGRSARMRTGSQVHGFRTCMRYMRVDCVCLKPRIHVSSCTGADVLDFCLNDLCLLCVCLLCRCTRPTLRWLLHRHMSPAGAPVLTVAESRTLCIYPASVHPGTGFASSAKARVPEKTMTTFSLGLIRLARWSRHAHPKTSRLPAATCWATGEVMAIAAAVPQVTRCVNHVGGSCPA